MKIEEMIDLFEVAAKSVDGYNDIRVYKYRSQVSDLLDSIMTFEKTPEKPLEAISRLEDILHLLSEKIKMRHNFQFVIRQIDFGPY